MKKRTYRTVDVESFDVAQLRDQASVGRWIVAIDVAKTRFVAAIATGSGQVAAYVKFEHPRQTNSFVAMVRSLQQGDRAVECVMEPTGTYGDSLRHQLLSAGLVVFAVSPNRVHDAAEVYDGVPSLHDAKASMIIARLHAEGVSRLWRTKSTEERSMRALVEQRRVYDEALVSYENRLHALLVRHWPELPAAMDLGTVTALTLLSSWPTPALLCANEKLATETVERVSRNGWSSSRFSPVVEQARQSLGEPAVREESEWIGAMAREALRLKRELGRIDDVITDALETTSVPASVLALAGPVLCAAMLATLGPLHDYPSARALEKVCGLNLTEHSSGEYKGQRRIAKRGPSVVRRMLYLAALRMIANDPIARAWVQRRAGYTDEHKMKAVVALMRKLVRAIFAMRNGEAYDASKLFDARRLDLVKPREQIAASRQRRRDALRAQRTTAGGAA